ncbi:MAG: BatA domain-containing protein [bacterium]
MFGLSFLNSLFLWGVAAASLPIIIHLIKRNRAIRLHFAAMRFLRLEPNERYKSQRLKQILLLLLRITALMILAGAFARPFLANHQTAPFWGNEPKAVVILVDNSFSMAAGNRFEQAVNKAKEVVKGLRPRDQVTVMQFSESSEVLGETSANFAALADQLGGRVRLSRRSTNYMQALQAAESALLEFPYNLKSITLISDFQRSGWDELNPHWSVLEGIEVNFLAVGDREVVNVAVQDLHIAKDERKRKRADVLARVKNFGKEKRKITTRLYLNRKKISQRVLTFLAGEEKTIRFKRVRLSGAFVTGFIELNSEDDALELDNRYYFVVQSQAQSKILAVNGEPRRDAATDELFFMERAINLPGLAKYALVKALPKELEKHDFKDYRAIILANVKDLSRSAVERLKYYVRGGGGLIVTLGDRVSPKIFNRQLQDLVPATLSNRAFKSVEHDNGVILAEVDYQHPIFRLFADPGQSDPSMAEFYQYFYARPMEDRAVLAYFDDGSPAILERKVGAGKVVLFTSTIDTEWNNLPVKALYLPLLYQTLQYVASENKGQESLLVGNPVALRGYGFGPESNDKAVITRPSGESVTDDGSMFDGTEEPGIYELRREGGRRPLAYFAVNVAARESDLSSATEIELQAKMTQVATEVQSAAVADGRFMDQVEKNQKLWRFGILLVLLMLVAETWLANRTYR